MQKLKFLSYLEEQSFLSNMLLTVTHQLYDTLYITTTFLLDVGNRMTSFIVHIEIKCWLHLMSFSESEIPQVSVSKARVLQHGEDFTITCNVTRRQLGSTQLKRVSWYKDGVRLETLRNPDPSEPRDSLGPLNLKSVGVRDGGRYTCLLEVLLRYVKEYNVSDTIKVESKYMGYISK